MIMKKSIKILLFLFASLTVLTFTGCMTVDIDVGIDDGQDAFIRYDLVLDMSEFDSRQAATIDNSIDSICDYYEDLGFNVKKSGTSSSKTSEFEFTKTVSCNSTQEAFEELEKMLTDESMTPFSKLDMTTTSTDFQQLFHMDGALDFKQIYNNANIDDFSPTMQELFADTYVNSEGTLTVLLPGIEAENASGETDYNEYDITMTVPIDFEGETSFLMTTRLDSPDGKVSSANMERMIGTMQKRQSMWIVFGIVGGVVFLIGIVMFFVMGRKKQEIAIPPMTNPNVNLYDM